MIVNAVSVCVSVCVIVIVIVIDRTITRESSAVSHLAHSCITAISVSRFARPAN